MKGTLFALALLATAATAQDQPAPDAQERAVVPDGSKAVYYPNRPTKKLRQATLREPQRFLLTVRENYPRQAMIDNLQGSVTIQTRVSPEGRASECDVTSSSGHAILDEAACETAIRHARFDPPLTRKGNRGEGRWSGTLNYSLSTTIERSE